MRSLRPLLALLTLVLPLAGCFQVASTITVRPDGSALVRDSVSLSGMAAMALMEDGEEKEGIDKTRLQARAAELGPGVTLMSLEEREDGFTAVYSVPDIRQLQYTVPDLPLGEDDEDDTVADESLNLTFGFSPGDPAVLRVIIPEEDDEEAMELPEDQTPLTAAEQAEAEQGLRIARALMGDARITVRVAVEGDVVESDAAFLEGSTATVYDLDFGALFDAIEENPALMRQEDPPLDQFRTLLAGREGVRLQEPGTLTVRFE